MVLQPVEPRLAEYSPPVNQPSVNPGPFVLGPDLSQDVDGFPHRGTINFVNNQVNPTTGSILVRGVSPNPQSEGGGRPLSPGMFVRVRLPIGSPHPAVLVTPRRDSITVRCIEK